MQRRELLKTGALCSALLLLPVLPVACRQALPLYDWTKLAQWTTGLETDQIATLGRQAVATEQTQRWRSELPELPILSWLNDGAGSAAEPETLKSVLGSESRRQFAANQTVILGGWVVSRLDAALCALAVS